MRLVRTNAKHFTQRFRELVQRRTTKSGGILLCSWRTRLKGASRISYISALYNIQYQVNINNVMFFNTYMYVHCIQISDNELLARAVCFSINLWFIPNKSNTIQLQTL